jgi:ElaB/YqjD/DUF883 family membrane-anchored ribosome-binding protein
MATTAEQISRANGRGATASERPDNQLHKFLDDVEDLLRRVTRFEDADIAKVRTRIESSIESVRQGSERTMRKAIDSSKAAAHATDEFVHRRPWTAIGVTAIAAMAIGTLLRRR